MAPLTPALLVADHPDRELPAHLHELLSHQAAMLVLSVSAAAQVASDPEAALLSLAQIGTVAETCMRELRALLRDAGDGQR